MEYGFIGTRMSADMLRTLFGGHAVHQFKQMCIDHDHARRASAKESDGDALLVSAGTWVQ
jgi:hypothetical protein